jgi:hypothetical protein
MSSSLVTLAAMPYGLPLATTYKHSRANDSTARKHTTLIMH